MIRAVILSLLLSAPSHAAAAAIVVGDGFEVERYAVSLRPDLGTTAVAGTETIVVRGTGDGTLRLVFSGNALRVEAATVDGVAVPVASGKDGVVFTLRRALREGARVTVRFGFAGVPTRGVAAVPGGVVTSYFACDWMVCLQDAPGDKAALALDLWLPARAESVGVGRALPTRAVGGLAVHRWRSTRDYPAFTYGFAAGAFAKVSVRSGAGTFAYYDAGGAGASFADAFARTPAMAAFFADKAGLPLPDGRYAQVLTPGREAQEAAGFSLIGRQELYRERDDPGAAWVIAHELAHQWWGNLVTCASWREFWLNEGVATFMVAAWKEHALGPAAYARELDVARDRVARVRALGFDKPLGWGGTYPSLGARRAVQYSKGALFLAELRGTIGDRAFWAGLRGYTRRHAGGTVTSGDLRRAMERASGRDLSAMFATWVGGEDLSR